MASTLFVQGDIMLKKVDSIVLKESEKIGEQKYVIATGEKTGHSHVIHGDIQIFKKYSNKNSNIFISIGQDGAVLRHELLDGSWTKEHYLIPIEGIDTGIYKVIQQRELTLLDEIRSVND